MEIILSLRGDTFAEPNLESHKQKPEFAGVHDETFITISGGITHPKRRTTPLNIGRKSIMLIRSNVTPTESADRITDKT